MTNKMPSAETVWVRVIAVSHFLAAGAVPETPDSSSSSNFFETSGGTRFASYQSASTFREII
jgi:hypothetical protein